MKPELLSPAGDIEAGYAALHYGADAVYLGLQKFSARATATNFDAENLGIFTNYAHALKRKVYVAVNTLVQESELSALMQTLQVCADVGVDAIILQDLGVARVIKRAFPELVLHASTQMAVHNLSGAMALKEIGFSRVVLARELTLPEISEIAEKSGLETEVFIHGALCYSYSGLCLFSSMMTGKSANRGKCLYPCRELFNGTHPFSMKDLALGADVLKLPVTSLKIEGRKKSALYVAAVTDYYRGILDGQGADADKEDRLKQIFARPWTKLHVMGHRNDVIDPDFVGHRGLEIGRIQNAFKDKIVFKTNHVIEHYDGIQIDVVGMEKPFGFSVQKMKVNDRFVFEAKPGDTVEVMLPPDAPFLDKGATIYLSSSSRVKGSYHYVKPNPATYIQRFPVSVKVTISSDALSATGQGKTVSIKGSFEPSKNPEKVTDAIQKSFDKTGDTPFYLASLTVENPNGLFVPASLLNDLRRDLYAGLSVPKQDRALPSLDAPVQHADTHWVVKTDDASMVSELPMDEVAEIILSITPDFDLKTLDALPKKKIRLSLPTICRDPKTVAKLVQAATSQGYKKWEANGLWALEILPKHGIDLTAGPMLYAMNSESVQQMKDLGFGRISFSFEDTLDNMKKLNSTSPLPTTFVAYADVPLFISDNPVPIGNLKKGMDIFEGKGDQVFHQKPFSAASFAVDIRPDFVQMDVAGGRYTASKVRQIFEKIRAGQDMPNAQKGNLLRQI